MKVLAFETATMAGAAAIVVDGIVLGETVATKDRRHAETLVPAARSLLDEAGVELGELDAIVVDVGPGLFTGLRVGVASARSLAFALEVPVVRLTSLEILANDPHVRAEETCLAIVDARRAELFVQAFERQHEAMAPRGEPALVEPAVLADRLASEDGNPALVGDGARRYRELLEGHGRVLDVAIPSPGVAGQLAEQGIGERVEDVSQVFPLYLRDPDAVANFSVAASFFER